MLECQICGYKACEHIEELVSKHVDESVRLHTVLETAARIAGEKLTGKTLPEEHIRRMVDMIIRQEHTIAWMTYDERTGMESDINYHTYLIEELKAQVASLEKKVQELSDQG